MRTAALTPRPWNSPRPLPINPYLERLTRLLDPLDPAELHGLLCGLLCADPRPRPRAAG
ncbi:MAG: hypothetical protein MZV65_01855 [Chromatiales bacterium]|nr:hypothetical protein [Chromatiales bacterium]